MAPKQTRPGTWIACALAAWLATSVASEASAEDVALRWSAPPECPQRDGVSQRVAAMLATSRAPADGVRARGKVTKRRREPYHLSLLVEVDGHRATRELDANDCATLSETGAWLIAVAVDPDVPPPAPPPSPEPPPEPPTAAPLPAPPPAEAEATAKPTPPPPKPQEPAPPATPDAPRNPLPRWWRAGVYGGMWSADLPGPAAQLGARAGLGFGWLYAELRADHVFARSRTLAAPGASATFSTQTASAALCAEWGARLRAGPCLTASGARTVGETQGVTSPGTDTVWWALGGASAGLFVRVWKLVELSAEGGAALPLSPRPRFGVQGLGPVGESSLFAGYARLGLSVRGP